MSSSTSDGPSYVPSCVGHFVKLLQFVDTLERMFDSFEVCFLKSQIKENWAGSISFVLCLTDRFNRTFKSIYTVDHMIPWAHDTLIEESFIV